MNELTKQQKIEMQEVVGLMPGVFRPDFAQPIHVHGPKAKQEITEGCAIIFRCLAEAQHVAWVCDRLMAWLEGKDYHFRRATGGVWFWQRGVKGLETGLCSWWLCLYAAWQHWQNEQKPKEKTLREELVDVVNCRLVHTADIGVRGTGNVPGLIDAIMDIIEEKSK